MNLDAFLDEQRTPLATWRRDHADDLAQASRAVLNNEQLSLIYEWLTEHCGFPGGITTFKSMAKQWKKEARVNSTQ